MLVLPLKVLVLLVHFLLALDSSVVSSMTWLCEEQNKDSSNRDYAHERQKEKKKNKWAPFSDINVKWHIRRTVVIAEREREEFGF